ncbi:hypothetical protein HKD37_19G053399 [Glycine soja]
MTLCLKWFWKITLQEPTYGGSFLLWELYRLRYYLGNFLGAFCLQTEILLIIQSKLWGMLHGINLAKEKWYRNLEIHSHANDAIQMVKGLANPNQHEKLILDAIKASIMPAMTVQFSHVYRECNKVADLLAKKVKIPSGVFVDPTQILSLSDPTILLRFVIIRSTMDVDKEFFAESSGCLQLVFFVHKYSIDDTIL